MVAVQRYHNQRRIMFSTQINMKICSFILCLMEIKNSLIFKIVYLNQNDNTSLDTISEKTQRKLISTVPHCHNVLERKGIPLKLFTTPIPKMTVISSM